jgi:hypothetical protein
MEHLVIRPITKLAEDWMFIVFLLGVLALAWTKYFNPGRLARSMQSAFNIRLMRQVIREESRTPRENVLFNFVYFTQLALFVFLLCKYWAISIFGFSGIVLYLMLIAFVLVVYALKALGIAAIRFIANGDFGLAEYQYHLFLVYRLAGIVLVPINAIICYSDIALSIHFAWAAVAVIGVAFVYRLFRGLFSGLSSGVSPFYIFFYICTLEILPLLIFYRAITL